MSVSGESAYQSFLIETYYKKAAEDGFRRVAAYEALEAAGGASTKTPITAEIMTKADRILRGEPDPNVWTDEELDLIGPMLKRGEPYAGWPIDQALRMHYYQELCKDCILKDIGPDAVHGVLRTLQGERYPALMTRSDIFTARGILLPDDDRS